MSSSNCCGCIPVKSGVITLGVLSMIGGVIDIIFGSLIIADSSCDSYWVDEDCYYDDSNSWYGTTSIIQGCMGIFVSILLLIGVSNRKHNLLMPYCAMMIVNVVTYICVGILLLANADAYDGAYYGVWLLVWSCVLCYFVSVVRLYRIMMFQQILAANGLITTYPSGAVLSPGIVVNNPHSNVNTVYTTQPIYNNQGAYTNQLAYPAPGSYPQPGYPQPGNPQPGYPQQGYPQPGYPHQSPYPPPYPGNQPEK